MATAADINRANLQKRLRQLEQPRQGASAQDINRARLEQRLEALRLPSTTGPRVAQPGDIQPQPLQEQFQGLLSKLGGRLPSKGPLPLEQFTGLIAQDFRPLGRGLIRQEESRRRNAFQQLRAAGHSIDAITGALAFEQAVKPPSKIPQTIGAIGGGILASKLIPGPIDDVLIAHRLLRGGAKATIAGLGGVAGKAIQIASDPDAEFNAIELARVFGEEAGLEAASLGAARVGRKLIGGVKNLVPGAVDISESLAREGQRLGIQGTTRLPAAAMSENALIDTIQGIGENSLLGSNAMLQFKRGTTQAAESIVDSLADTISRGTAARSSDEMASLLVDAIEQKGIAHGVAAKQLYGSLDVATAGAAVDMSQVKGVAQEMISRASRAGNIGISEASQSMLGRISNQLDQSVSFETAQDIRSGLLDIVRKGTSKITPDPKAVGIAKRLVSQVDASMAQAAKDAGPETEKLFRRANKFFKAGKDRFGNKTIRTLVRQLEDPALSKPEVANVIFRSRENINRVRKAAGPELFQKAKGSWIESIVKSSMKPDPSDVEGIGEAVGTRMLKQFNGIGQDALDAAFSATEQKQIRDGMRGLALVQERTGGQAGALRFVQGAALAGIVTGPFVENERVGSGISGASGLLLLGPAVLGKLLTKPTFIKLLSEGFKAPRGSQQSVALTARLIRNVLQVRKEINTEREKARTEAARDLRRRQVKAPPARQGQAFRGGSFR